MPAKQVLIVEDEKPIREMIAFGLKRHGFEVREAEDCRSARAALADKRPDLILIDWMLPDMSGLELARALKRDRETRELPIIMLTARAEEGDKVAGLEGGADDYVTKPFSPRELLARIRAVLRRAQMEVVAPGRDETLRAYRFEGWELNVRLHRLLSPAGERIEISRGEFSLLCALLSSPKRILSRDQLLELSRLHSTEVYDRSIDVQILRLRRKIEADPSNPTLIRTERGVGYYFDAPVKVMR
jgi:two-component system, OmpR family, response regulator